MTSADEPDVAATGRRALRGAGLLVARGAVMLVLGLAANIVLARLLTPRDFGVVALGTVLLVFGTFLADAGLGAGLIRRADPPARRELEAVNGVQLGLTAAVAGAAFAVAVPLGRDALVISVMVAALPITMLKVPAVILLERRLEYGPIAWVDLIEAATFYVWAVVTVALGAGVWGFATAAAARGVVGVAAMQRLGPVGILRPRWSWPEVRPLLGFGAKFQGAVLANLVRDQSLNIGIAVVAGVATLGVWSLAWRVLQIPFTAFGSLGRIGFPAMARLLQAGHDPKAVIERAGAAVAILSGATMGALVGFAPALPVVLGPGWEDVPAVLLWSGMTLIVSFPVVLASSPYLQASDAGGTVVVAVVLGGIVWLAVALPLLPAFGAPAAAMGWAAGSVVQLTLLGTRTAARSGAAIGKSVGVPIVIGIAAAGSGWLVADAAGRSIGAGVAGAATAEAVLLVALLTLRGAAVRDTRRLITQAVVDIRGQALRPAAPRRAAN